HPPPPLHSSPTRRSSDLISRASSTLCRGTKTPTAPLTRSRGGNEPAPPLSTTSAAIPSVSRVIATISPIRCVAYVPTRTAFLGSDRKSTRLNSSHVSISY